MFIVNERQPCRLVGESEAIRRIEAEANAAALTGVPVLLVGEPGVGKALVAQWIHHASPRAAAPFLALNCDGLPDFLFESELCGHLRGSFPGAYRDKPGLLELAPDATLFLDGVDGMSLAMQTVLVQLLESGEIQRIGADTTGGRVQFRLIAATEHDLDLQLEGGGFHRTLHSRLGGFRLVLPPLRERAGDIPSLVAFFLDSHRRQGSGGGWQVAPEAMDALVAHRWPGNIRELKHTVERAAELANGHVIRLSNLPENITGPLSGASFPDPGPSWSPSGGRSAGSSAASVGRLPLSFSARTACRS